VVAEQFGVLESLYPGRIDMGLGRSVGFTDGVRRALGRDKDAADDFAGQLTDLLGYFTTGHDGVHAFPAEGLRVPAFVLATGAGADIAADFGLPVVVGGPKTEDTVARYRSRARNPHVIVAVTVAVADTTEQARRLLLPEAWSMVYSRSHGVFPPLLPVDDVLALDMTASERARLDRGLDGQIYGTEDEVLAALDDLSRRTQPDELLVTMSTFDRDQMLDSYRRLITAVRGADRTAGSAPARGTT
jgi:luciferase family oxidoreductase group 1